MEHYTNQLQQPMNMVGDMNSHNLFWEPDTQFYQHLLIELNEGYMCNTCKVGKVRPIQFSLKQAIVNCDNLDCDSYLEKWPWECVITRPILNLSDSYKYEKDLKCNINDSSGIHSDLGSSCVSQYSMTDREEESLLQKSYTSTFDFEGVHNSQHTLLWQSGTTIQQQEPLVALDDKMLSTNMPSSENENFVENKYNLLVNNFQSVEESRNINASDTDISQDKDIHYWSYVDNDTESCLCKSESSDLSENSVENNCDIKWQLGNGDSSCVKKNNLSSLVKQEIFTKVEEEEAYDPLADASFKSEEEEEAYDPLADASFKSEEYELDFELPIATVDENDLKFSVPVKDETKERKELDILSHNLVSIQDYSRPKKILHQNLGSSRIKNCSAIPCQLLPNSCENSSTVIDTQNHIYSRPSHYNFDIDTFTMSRCHDKFGDLKKGPEFFEAYLSDHDDSKDRLSSLGQANFLCEMNESENFEVCGIGKAPKITKCKFLKNKSYMGQLLGPCRCNNSDFDTSFARSFSNLPSKQTSKNSNKKNLRSSSVSSICKNTTVSDVLNLLKELGWIVAPLGSVINYKQVSVQHKENSVHNNNKNSKENLKSTAIEKYKINKKNDNSGFDLFPRNKFLKNENYSFNDLSNLCSFEAPKRKKKELVVTPLRVSNDLGLNDTGTLKAFKTYDGCACIKKESEENFGNSEESIELPDDHLAYVEEAIKEDYNVIASPTRLKNAYISSLPFETKVKTRKRNQRKCKLCQ